MIIEKAHHEYLLLQRGDISHETNLERWKFLYATALQHTVDSIAGALAGIPPKAKVLDVGGGMGGVHIGMSDLLGGTFSLHILDGLNDPPVHKNSFTTFNNAAVGTDFLNKNGVKNVRYVDSVPAEKFDLVVSFAAYGFHIHPGSYIEDLKKATHDETVLIFDVRRSKKEWLRSFIEAFGNPRVLSQEEKYVRLAFRG